MASTLPDLIRRLLGEMDAAAEATRVLGSPGAGADSGPRPGECPLSIAGATLDLPVYLSLSKGGGGPLMLASLPRGAAMFERTAALGRIRISLVRTVDEGT